MDFFLPVHYSKTSCFAHLENRLTELCGSSKCFSISFYSVKRLHLLISPSFLPEKSLSIGKLLSSWWWIQNSNIQIPKILIFAWKLEFCHWPQIKSLFSLKWHAHFVHFFEKMTGSFQFWITHLSVILSSKNDVSWEKLASFSFDFNYSFPGKSRLSQHNVSRAKTEKFGAWSREGAEIMIVMTAHATPVGWEWPQSRVHLAPWLPWGCAC